MSRLDRYNFSKTLSLLNNPELVTLTSCSVCNESLTENRTFVTGKCVHGFCEDCVKDISASSCPAPSCEVSVQPRDFTQHKVLGQVANHLDALRVLLLKNGRNAALETKNEESVESSSEQVQRKTENSSTSETTRKSRNKENVIGELRKAVLDEATTSKHTVTKRKKGSKQNNDKSDEMDDGQTEENVVKKGKQRLSLPQAAPIETVKKRVRSATVEPPKTTKTTVKVGNLEKKNKKGETPLHVACGKGHLDRVGQLLDEGANPNTQDNAGWTPLHEVASCGRIEIAKLLLKAGANPTVPDPNERVTALHDAVSAGDVTMITLLVSFGADRDVKDSDGRTPRSIAANSSDDIIKAVEDTKVLVDLNESVRANSSSKEMIICLSKKVCKNLTLKKLATDGLQRFGLKKPTVDFTVSVTHFIVDDNEDVSPVSYEYLASIIIGAEIIRSSWITECGKQGKILKTDPYVINFHEDDEEGVIRSRDLIMTQQPKLLTGLHFYLIGSFDKLSREQVSNLIKLSDGKIVARQPDPECIPPHEVSIPHHVQDSSPLVSTSHVIIYQEGDREPLLKYNMPHVKTLPLNWLVNSIRNCVLLDPHKQN